jgi:hypothetical protein
MLLGIVLFLALVRTLGISSSDGDPVEFGIFVGLDLAFVLPSALIVV